MTVGVVQFPGTNCELDVLEVVRAMGGHGNIVWHGDQHLDAAVDAVVIPGGFAHGDYLRTGAIARFSPIMDAITRFAADGGPVLGICNGFQVLCEAGLLPGALRKNAGLKFRCADAQIRIETTRSCATSVGTAGQVLRLPINHFEGNYMCDSATLAELRAEQRVVFRYVDNPNGSVDDIAGVCNAQRNVVGLMPHPERACHELLGSTDGVVVIGSLLAVGGTVAVAVSG
jgi:phosphoribosylformylglycinamidine synthase subunit PurQ / glutaminase